jgi:hypothetical protein
MQNLKFKFLSGSTLQDSSLTDRQVRVIANSGLSDRDNEVFVPSGCNFKNYLLNPVVQAEHDRTKTVGNFAPEIKGNLQGVITFAPAGISALADEYCAMYKAGVRRAVSIGARIIKGEPTSDGGYRFTEWELVELSCVAVPCDPGAVVIGRSAYEKSGRVLSGTNATKLQQAHDAAESCRSLVADVLDGAGGGDTDDAKAMRRRQIKILELAAPPPMSRSERMAMVRELDIWCLRNAP